MVIYIYIYYLLKTLPRVGGLPLQRKMPLEANSNGYAYQCKFDISLPAIKKTLYRQTLATMLTTQSPLFSSLAESRFSHSIDWRDPSTKKTHFKASHESSAMPDFSYKPVIIRTAGQC